jgi:hypothetical protein
MYTYIKMAGIAVGLLALCCCSSSAGAGGFFGGLIPGTEPHFLKVTKAREMKEIVAELKNFTNDHETQIKTRFPNADPDMSNLSAEDRAEYMTMAKEKLSSLRNGEICVKVKDNTDENGKFLGQTELKEYGDNVFTLNGTKGKNKLFREYVVGFDEVDDMVGVCIATDKEFNELVNR